MIRNHLQFHRWTFLQSSFLLLLLLCWGAGPLSANEDWWNEEWTGRMKITVDTTEEGFSLPDSPGSVPVLLRLHGGNFPFAAIHPDGSDIRFVADGGTDPLPYQIERIDSLLQEAFIWVWVPEIEAGGEKTLWLYYGKSGSVPRGENSSEVFGEESTLVYHFTESGAAPADSTGNGNHGDRAGIPVQGALISGALRLTGHQPIQIASSPTLTTPAGSPMTVSLWINPSSTNGDQVLLSQDNGFQLGIQEGTPYVQITANGSSQTIQANAPIEASSWTHLAFTSNSSETTLYIDGQSVGGSAVGSPTLAGPLFLGTAPDQSNGFSGEIDELRIAQSALSPSQLLFQAINQGTAPEASSLVRIEYDDVGTGNWLDGEGYFFVILKTLDASGWSVIVILAVMSAWSWIVMISKMAALSRMRSVNRKFVSLWHTISQDLTVLDNPEEIQTLGGKVQAADTEKLRTSPVFKLYHTGVSEIRHRFENAESSTRKLSGASLQAIRSAMMTTYVRQNQRLNKRVVHLQIAVAGGPFLGLFGTVLGVTVTFAVIASSGDVNVASIAPGVSGALLTTVAGLIVAIPALFGYNYIVGQIKDIVSDMRVFTDEFITKAAEFYSRKNRKRVSPSPAPAQSPNSSPSDEDHRGQDSSPPETIENNPR